MRFMDGRQRLILAFTAMILTAGCAAPFPPPGLEREEVIEVGMPTDTLMCPSGGVASPDTRNIGAGGGELATAGHRLTIPASAVSAQRQIIFREHPGEMVGVEIQQRAESNALARSARLRIDASRCSSNAIGARVWFIWRMNAAGTEGQKLRTRREGSMFVAPIDSTSGFIIAH